MRPADADGACTEWARELLCEGRGRRARADELAATVHYSGVYSSIRGMSSTQLQGVREAQKIRICGVVGGSVSNEPAGTTIALPLRVGWGSGEPQREQKIVAKLTAVGRS